MTQATTRRRSRTLQHAKPRGFADVEAQAGKTGLAVEVEPAKVEYIKSIYSDVMNTKPPAKLDVFLSVLKGTGYEILGKDEWKKIGGDLLPLTFPVAVKGSWDDDDIQVVSMLVRTPNGSPLSPEQFQVVSQRPRKSRSISLLALDIEKYIMKRAEEAHFYREKKDLPVIAATKDVYDVRFSGKDKTALDKWLLLEVGPFPEVYRNLAQEQLRADAQTGLIIADTMRDVFGANWAFPHAFVGNVLKSYFNDRELEASHSAARCFTGGYPLWSLEEEGDDLDKLLLDAQMEKLGTRDLLRVFYMKRVSDDQRAAVRTGSMSLGCATLAKAQALMDAVCCGYKSYNGIRKELTDLYEEVPGCEPLTDLISHFKQ